MQQPHVTNLRRPARQWLFAVALGIGLALGGLSLLSAEPVHALGDEVAAAVQPDIIVVMVDDLGYIPDERVLKRLPNIKRLWLDDGLRFTRLYDETPLCCPARATFLTGQHTLGHGVIDNEGDAMDPSSTIAVSLDEAGYQTLLMGKYLNRYDGTRTPLGWDRVFMRESSVVPSYSIDGELARYDGEHFDDVLRRTAVEWLGEAQLEEPVFALVAPRAPHRHPQMCKKGQLNCQYLPLVMEQDRGAAECRRIPKFKPPTYAVPESKRFVPWTMPDFPKGWPMRPTCESLLVIDRMVGQLLDVQAERDRPAYFVFLSDNGMSWGQKGFPLKHVPPATRLPFYVNGPDVSPGRTDTLLTNVDIAPTLAELAGATSPAPDGVSFVPLLRGQEQAGHDELLEIMPADPQGRYAGWAGLRTPKWRYIRWDSGKVELYDLSKDRWDRNNVAKHHRKRVRAMDARLDEVILASRGPSEAQP